MVRVILLSLPLLLLDIEPTLSGDCRVIHGNALPGSPEQDLNDSIDVTGDVVRGITLGLHTASARGVHEEELDKTR